MTNDASQAEGWRPEDGESIQGRVVDLTRGYSAQNGEEYPIVVLRTPEGAFVNVHAFHATLRNRLADIRPNIGDRLRITKEGRTTTKDGRREVVLYRVEAPDRERSSESFWTGVGGQRRAAQQQPLPGPAPAAPQQEVTADDDIPF